MRALLLAVIVFGVVAAPAAQAAPRWAGWLMTPGHEFGAKPLPPVPDYAKAENWAAWPGRGGAAERTPKGQKILPEAKRPADVFFVHPTTYFGTEGWLADVNNSKVNARTDGGSITAQASAFNGCCRIYAPRYRQVTFGAYVKGDKAALRSALDAAYQDVRAAFRYFLTHRDNTRPLVLASHSQGSAHLLRLLIDEVQSDANLRRQLVAAYVIGNRIPVAVFGSVLHGVGPCETADDTGCIISWDAYEEEAKGAQNPSPSGHWNGKHYIDYRPSDTLCINPVTWTRGSARSPRASHKGALVPVKDEAGPLPALLPRHLEAWCETGRGAHGLHVSGGRAKALTPTGLRATGSLHSLDYNLFYGDIRRNAVRRVVSFIRRSSN